MLLKATECEGQHIYSNAEMRRGCTYDQVARPLAPRASASPVQPDTAAFALAARHRTPSVSLADGVLRRTFAVAFEAAVAGVEVAVAGGSAAEAAGCSPLPLGHRSLDSGEARIRLQPPTSSSSSCDPGDEVGVDVERLAECLDPPHRMTTGLVISWVVEVAVAAAVAVGDAPLVEHSTSVPLPHYFHPSSAQASPTSSAAAAVVALSSRSSSYSDSPNEWEGYPLNRVRMDQAAGFVIPWSTRETRRSVVAAVAAVAGCCTYAPPQAGTVKPLADAEVPLEVCVLNQAATLRHAPAAFCCPRESS